MLGSNSDCAHSTGGTSAQSVATDHHGEQSASGLSDSSSKRKKAFAQGERHPLKRSSTYLIASPISASASYRFCGFFLFQRIRQNILESLHLEKDELPTKICWQQIAGELGWTGVCEVGYWRVSSGISGESVT